MKKTKTSCTSNSEKTIELHPIQRAIIEYELTNVMKLEQQLTYQECEELLSRFDKGTIWKVLNKMNNWKPLAKKNISVYRTLLNWIEREPKLAMNKKKFTAEEAMGWITYRNFSPNNFQVYFDEAGVDEKTGVKLFVQRF